jgi:Ser/Thr protein kinase RdoA (MazF antagonist)
MLGQSQIANYLVSLGLVEPRAVVEDGLRIVDVSRRNSVFLVTAGSGPTFAVKQAEPRSVPMLQHEAAVLRMLADVAELAGRVPTVAHEDPEMAVLVLRSPSGAQDFTEHHSAGRFPRTPAGALGRGLATLHGLPAGGVANPPSVDRMWGLSLPDPPHQLILDLSIAAQDLVARLQANTAMSDRLTQLRDTALEDAFVHGDLRWENCLAVPAPGSRRRTRVLLVDWEFAGHGESSLDIGTVLAEYLCACVWSIPIVDTADPGRLLSQARYPLRRMHPALGAFWSAYLQAVPAPPSLRRVTELAAVRVLQTAVERAQSLSVPSAHLVTLLQLSENLLQQPETAALTLLGLRQ